MVIHQYNKVMDVENYEKGKLIKDALILVSQLAENDLADIDGNFDIEDFDYNTLQKLIVKARDLKRNRWWDVPGGKKIV